jgi:hypothetical protein
LALTVVPKKFKDEVHSERRLPSKLKLPARSIGHEEHLWPHNSTDTFLDAQTVVYPSRPTRSVSIISIGVFMTTNTSNHSKGQY